MSWHSKRREARMSKGLPKQYAILKNRYNRLVEEYAELKRANKELAMEFEVACKALHKTQNEKQ